jgi:hypothetical protein
LPCYLCGLKIFKPEQTMKKVFAMLMVCGLAVAFVACGGADKAAAEAKAKATADSIAVADSLAKIAAEAAAAADTVKTDSTAK